MLTNCVRTEIEKMSSEITPDIGCENVSHLVSAFYPYRVTKSDQLNTSNLHQMSVGNHMFSPGVAARLLFMLHCSPPRQHGVISFMYFITALLAVALALQPITPFHPTSDRYPDRIALNAEYRKEHMKVGRLSQDLFGLQRLKGTLWIVAPLSLSAA